MQRNLAGTFSPYALPDDRIEWDQDGFTIIARIEYDEHTDIDDSDCYEQAGIDAWKRDEWFFVGVVLGVYKNGVLLTDHGASLWGIECDFPGCKNEHLTEIAHELADEALKTARTELERIKAALCCS